MKNYTTWEEHKKDLLKDPEVRKALEETRLEYEIARAVIAARLRKGLSQTELAAQLSTRQSAISRIENANTTPSLSFLKKLAAALDSDLVVSFKPAK